MNKAKNIFFGAIIGACISLTVNIAICGLQRFRTIPERTDKRPTLNERVTQLEIDVKQLKEKKHGQMVK